MIMNVITTTHLSIAYLKPISYHLGNIEHSNIYDDIIRIFSALLAICAGSSLVTGKFPPKDQWRGALMFSLICAWLNGWVNYGDAGDLRRHRAHYDVVVRTVHQRKLNGWLFLTSALVCVCHWIRAWAERPKQPISPTLQKIVLS